MKNIPSLLLFGMLLLAGGCSRPAGFAIINTTDADVILSMALARQLDFELYTAPVDQITQAEHWTRIDQWYRKDTTAEGDWKWGMTLSANTALIMPTTNRFVDGDGFGFPVTSMTLRGTRGTVYVHGGVVGATFIEESKGWYQFTYR